MDDAHLGKLRPHFVGICNLGGTYGYRITWQDARIRGSIDKARIDYDNGMVELCQGRVGEILFLFAIPRRERAVRKEPRFRKA